MGERESAGALPARRTRCHISTSPMQYASGTTGTGASSLTHRHTIPVLSPGETESRCGTGAEVTVHSTRPLKCTCTYILCIREGDRVNISQIYESFPSMVNMCVKYEESVRLSRALKRSMLHNVTANIALQQHFSCILLSRIVFQKVQTFRTRRPASLAYCWLLRQFFRSVIFAPPWYIVQQQPTAPVGTRRSPGMSKSPDPA